MAVEWNAEEITRRIRIGANRGVLIAAQAVEARGSELILQPPKSGRVYRRRGVSHQASAPGEAPASDTGRLVNSSDVIANPETLSARINWSANYARRLELGDELLAPRPFARRALAERHDEIEEAVRSQIAAALKSA